MRHKLFRRLTAIALSAALAASLAVTASASGMTYVTPTAPTTVDDDLILIAAHAQADVMPEVLGITNTTDRASEVPAEYSLEHAQQSELIGIFGKELLRCHIGLCELLQVKKEDQRPVLVRDRPDCPVAVLLQGESTELE